MKNNRLRLSYSLLYLWSAGRTDEAVALYTHKDLFKVEAFEVGKEWHKKWENQINTTKKLTIGKETFTFKDPTSEVKIVIPYNERWDLVGVVDIVDTDRFFELKSGTTSAWSYLQSYQIPLYFLLLDRAGTPKDSAMMIHYNQKEDFVESIPVWRSEEEIEEATNWIDSMAPEIESFFLEKNIL